MEEASNWSDYSSDSSKEEVIEYKVYNDVTWYLHSSNVTEGLRRIINFIRCVKKGEENWFCLGDDLECNYDPTIYGPNHILVDWDVPGKHRHKKLPLPLIIPALEGVVNKYSKCDKCSNVIGPNSLVVKKIRVCYNCVAQHVDTVSKSRI